MKSYLKTLAAVALMAANNPAISAIFVVTSTADTDGATCTATCTFRQAINAANSGAGADTINFNVQGAGVQTFARTSNYPALTGPTVIDGYTQPGATANTLAVGSDANILIRITGGTNTLGQARGFIVSGGGSTIRGVSISVSGGGSPGLGIEFTDSVGNTNNVVEGVWIGLSADGLSVSNALQSIQAFGASNTSGLRLGGPSPQQRNVLQSGEVPFAGPVPALDIASNSAVIINNYFNLDKTGSVRISAGLAPTLPNGARFGGPSAAERNVLLNGVNIASGSGVIVEGNYFGIGADGGTPINGSGPHISVNGGSAHVIRGNVIASGDGSQKGIVFGTVAASNVQILGNKIGIAANGSTARGLAVGIQLGSGAVATIIGGVGNAEGNIIANSVGAGIEIDGASGSQIIGNTIGLNAFAQSAGNLGAGIRVLHNGSGNQIGSTVPGGANEITRNGTNGIAIISGNNNRIIGNRIYDNAGLEIDLGNGTATNGADPNDNLDADTGGNTRLNHPVINNVNRAGNQVTAALSFGTAPNLSGLTVDFYRSNKCDNTGGLGEAQRFVFSANSLTSNAAGLVIANVPFTDSNLAPTFYAALLSDTSGNTSEISPCVSVPAGLLFYDGME